MNKTKEAIAYECTNGIFNEYELGIIGLSKAMEEYAKQEAISFQEWKLENMNTSSLVEHYGNYDILWNLYQKSKAKINE